MQVLRLIQLNYRKCLSERVQKMGLKAAAARRGGRAQGAADQITRVRMAVNLSCSKLITMREKSSEKVRVISAG